MRITWLKTRFGARWRDVEMSFGERERRGLPRARRYTLFWNGRRWARNSHLAHLKRDMGPNQALDILARCLRHSHAPKKGWRPPKTSKTRRQITLAKAIERVNAT